MTDTVEMIIFNRLLPGGTQSCLKPGPIVMGERGLEDPSTGSLDPVDFLVPGDGRGFARVTTPSPAGNESARMRGDSRTRPNSMEHIRRQALP